MNDDLISRDALKSLEYINKGNFNTVEGIREWVDNAPTVNAIPNKEGYEMYNKGYMSGYERGKEERPQGEWLITDSYPHRVYCSKCFKTFAHADWEIWKDGGLPRNFCPNCGADMRVKNELNNELNELKEADNE